MSLLLTNNNWNEKFTNRCRLSRKLNYIRLLAEHLSHEKANIMTSEIEYDHFSFILLR
jgi:hypothetical protein